MTNNPTAILCLLLSCLSVVQAAGGRGTVFGVVPEREHAGQGVVVNRVAEQTPAQLAGLQSGDVIVSVQGIPTPTAAELKAALAEFAPGDVVRVQYLRGGRRLTTLVELQGRKSAEESVAAPAPELSPEVQLQFAQARSRLKIQLSRLPYRMNSAQVQADLRELLMLARAVPSGHSQWLQGQSVEMSLVLPHKAGDVELRSENGRLSLAVQPKSGEEPVVYPINTQAERAALPAYLLQRLQEL
jgi:hypothetical protein